MAFKHHIWLATYLAANLSRDRFRITPDIRVFSKLLHAAIWSCCAVWFESEQTPFPRTGLISFATYFAAKWLWSIHNHARHRFQAFARRHLKSLCCSIQIWADALSSDSSSTLICCFAQDLIRNLLFCSYVIFLLRDQWMFARLSEAMGEALVGNNFWSIPWDHHFPMKKNLSSLPNIYKALRPF